MKLLLDFPTIGEPHYAQALPAAMIKDQPGQDLLAEGEHGSVRGQDREGDAGRAEGQAWCTSMMIVDPQPLHAGQHRGHPGGRHGLLPRHQPRAGLGRPARLRGAGRQQLRAAHDAGRDAHARVGARAGRASIPFYCTDFCSALHQEMQGYIRVSPAGLEGGAQVEQPELQAQAQEHEAKAPSERRRARDAR